MVSVVTGNGNGLVNTSRDVLGAAGGLGAGTTGQAREQVTVNAANGNLVVQHRDEFLTGVGPDVDLLRTYNSQGGWDGDNGDRWRIGYYRQVYGLGGGTIKRVEADGRLTTYTLDGGTYVSKDGSGQYDTLSYDAPSDSWIWRDGDTGTTETYQLYGAGSYRLARVTTPDGHYVAIDYSGAQISQISTFMAGGATAVGTIKLTYTGAQLQSTEYWESSTKTRSLTRYDYDTSGRLWHVKTDLTPDDSVVTDGEVYTVTYGYDGTATDARLTSIEQTDGSKITIEYDTNGWVKSVKDDELHQTKFGYDVAGRTTTVTDPLNQATTLKYDANNQLLEIAGSAMGGTSFKQTFSYNAAGDLLTSQNAAGQTTTYAYDASGHGAWTRRTDAAGNVVDRSYDAATGLLLSETSYATPDADGVGATYQPGDGRKTRYFYDTTNAAKRQLAYVLGPQGEVTHYTYNGLGQMERQVQYTRARYTAADPTFAALETWAKGSQALTLDRQVTEYSYDVRGQLQEERHYTTESLSNSKAVVDGGVQTTTYTYDTFGRLAYRKDPSNVSLTYAYDGLGRISKTVDAKGVQTLYTYDDANRKTSVEFDNGQTTVQTFDTRGNLVSSDVMGVGHTSSNSKLLGKTEFAYDALGRLYRIKDATGVSTYSLFDVSGRKSADIAANGQLTEYVYEGGGRLIQTIAYATSLSATALSALTSTTTLVSIRPKASATLDRITTRYYDGAGRLTGILDAEGYLTENQYDGTGALVAQIAYANAVAVTRVDVSKGSTQVGGPAITRPTLDAASDRTTRNLYDSSGRLAARIDGAGALTQYAYDATGNLLGQLRRSVLLNGSQQTTATLAEVQALAPLNDDEFTQWVYDNAGRRVAQIDAEGYLTEFKFDNAGRPAGDIRYLSQAIKPVTSGSPATLKLFKASDLTDELRTLLSTPKAPLTTSKTYDSRGLLESETAVDGAITSYTFDKLLRLQTVTRAQGQTEERSQSITYDDWGRVSATQTVGEATGVTTTYDAAGRRTQVTDARGYSTVYYYDDQGREIYAILKNATNFSDEGEGEVTETLYSTFSEVTTRVTHRNRLSHAVTDTLTGGLATKELAASIRALTDTSDNSTTFSYNQRGLVQQAIDALGYKTDTKYNAFGQTATVVTDVDVSPGTRRLTRTDAYDQRGLWVRTDLDGPSLSTATTRAKYDALGRVTQRIDELHQETNTVYTRNTGSGRQIDVSGPAGTVSTTYDALDRVLTRRDGNSNTVKYSYDDIGRRFTVQTAEGIETTTETDRLGQTVKVTDGAGASTTYAYDTRGNLLTVTDALGNVTKNSYDANGNLVQMLRGLKANVAAAPTDDGSAIKTSYTYDAANRVLTQTVDPQVAGVGLALKTQFKYDGQGRKLEITDPRGVVTRQSFTAKGELSDVVVDANGLALKTSYTYDAQSRTLSVVEGAGTATARKRTYEYDVLGRRTAEVVDPSGLNLRTSFEYDAAGHLVLQRDPLDQINRFRYDSAGRLLYSIDGTGAVTRRIYDGEGRVVGRKAYATQLAAGWSAKNDADLDAALAALTTSSGGQLSSFAYDRDGRLIYSVDAGGNVTALQYDGAGRVVLSRQYATALTVGAAPYSLGYIADHLTGSADDRITRYAYDALGRQVFVIDALGGVTETRYNRTGLVVSRIDYARPLVSTEAANDQGLGQTYSLAGITKDVKTDAANDRVDQFSYDAAGRLRFKVDAEGYVAETRYDDFTGVTSLLRYAWRISGSSAYAPASTPRAMSTFTPAVMTALGGFISTSQTLDTAGHVASEVDGNGVTTTYAYDAGGRRTKVTYAAGRTEQTVTSYTYDAAGRMTQRTVADGTADASTTRYEYDALGQLIVEYDPRGVEVSETDSQWAKDERARRGYPAVAASALTAGQKLSLLNVYRTAYEYDAAGRRTVVHNKLRQISSFSYDAFGNVTRSTDFQGNPRYFYYDALNRQNLAVDAEGFATETRYDARFAGAATTIKRYHQRVVATENVRPSLVADPKDATTTHTYDRLGRLTQSTDAEQASESVSSGATNRFDSTSTNKLGGQTSVHTDRRGQVLTETLPVTAGGLVVINEYQYDAWGNRIQSIEAKGLAESRTTTYRYDGEGRLTLRMGTAFTALDTATLKTSSKVPAEQTLYDALGRQIEFISNAQWDGTKLVGGQRHISYYSASGLKIATVAPDGAMVTTQYDTAGLAYAETRYAAAVSLPAAGSRTKPTPVATMGKDRTSLMLYDAMGRLTQRQVLNLRYWEPGNDDANFTTALQDPGIVTVQRLFYDANGHVIEEDDARGNSRLYYYDKLGRRTLSVDQEGYGTGWQYNSFHDHATKQVRFALRVGAGVDNLDTLLNLYASVDNRITEFDLDRRGRVSESRLLSVATQFVSATGQVVSGTRNAVTQTLYNGLGRITQTREYVGLDDSGTEVWNQTDIDYDLLGRETSSKRQSFTDYNGNTVRPETATAYNGYGAISSRTEVGRVEAENRVTSYGYNANGELIKITDAEGNVTNIELNAQGLAARVTRVAVLRADDSTADLVKVYEYDAAGRQTAVKDVDTGETRRTRFNAFGEIEARGMGDDWQEYTEYNVLGKIERTNSGDGATKLYLYDRTGNATRLIKSTGTTDLRNAALASAAVDTTLNHTFSAYDRRGLLVKTADIKVSYLTDQTALQAAYSQKLTDFYGAVSISKADASNGSTFAVNASNSANLAVPLASADVSTLVPTDSRSVVISTGYYVQIPINYSGALLNETAVTVQMKIDGIAVSGTLASGYFTVSWGEMSSKGVGVGTFASRAVPYSYLVFVAPSTQTARINFAGRGDGTFQTGRASTVTPPTVYLPWLKLPGAKNVAWWVTNQAPTPPVAGASAYNAGYSPYTFVNMPGLDLRRYVSGTDTIINLQDFILPAGGGSNTVTLTYNTMDRAYTVVVKVAENGRVSITSTTSNPLNAASITLPLNGASSVTTFKRVKLITGNENPRMATTNEASKVYSVRAWLFGWSATAADAGTWAYYIESDDGSGHMATSGAGTYTVDANGKVTQASFTPDAAPAYVNFAPPAGTTGFKVSYRRKGSSGAWATVTNTTGLVSIGNGQWRLKANPLMPQASDPDTVTYDYTFEATNSTGGMVSKGGGDLVAQRSGVIGAANTYQDRLPLQPITFSGPVGRKDAAKMRLTYTPAAGGAAQTVTLTGTWLGSDLTGSYQYRWDNPFNGQSFAGETHFGFQMELLTSAGAAINDEGGKPIIEKGDMVVGASADSPFQLKQIVQTLNKSAQVKHLQTWNAFGEIDSEYDERTLDRATAMVQLYKDAGLGDFTSSLTQSALTTRLTYNTLGKLVVKEDPTAFETLANGFIRRTAAKTQYGYDLVGRMTVSTDANGNGTRAHYEGAGEADRTEWLPSAGSGTTDDPDLEAKRVQHADIFGDVRKLVDELQHTTEQKFDRNHNLIEVKKLGVTRQENFVDGEFDGLFRDYFKGANGVAPVGESLTTTYSYDALGQRIKRTDALGQTELTWYDGLGRVIKVSSAAGRSTLYGYDLISASDQSAKKVLGVGGASVGGHYKTTTQADGGVLKEAVDYFGHTTSHVDLGGNTFTYNYDFAGQLQSQSSVRAKAGATKQKIEYTYLQNGMLAEIRDLAAGQATLTRYGYDDAGNRTYEEYARLDTSIDSKGKVAEILQASSIVYDERNRIVRVADGIDASGAAIANTNNSTLTRSHDLRYEYDAVGNRRAAYYRYWNPLADGGAGKLTDSSNYYYTYDRANRFVITKGNLVRRGSSATDTTTSIVLGLEGTRLSYDAAGQRTKALHTDGSLEVYTYSSDGFLEDTLIQMPTDAKPLLSARRRVDAIGRTRDYVEYEGSATSPGGRAIRQRRTTAYDAENRVLVESVYGGSFAAHTNFVKGNIYSYFDGIAQTTSSTSGAGALASVFEYWTAETTLYSYELWDTAKQSKIDRRGDSIGLGWTSFVYDANGHLSSSSDEVGSVDVTYLTNAEGLVMRRQDVSRTDPSKSYLHQYYYATGRRVGDVGTNPEDKFRVSYVEQLAQSLPSTADTGYHPDRFESFAPITSADFDQSYEPINPDYPAATGVSYIARTGDTLRTIAQVFWGDSSLWYLLAEANGFHDDTRLVQGQVVVIPNKVTNFHNNASTFRPYNPGEVIGRIQPTLNDYEPFEYVQTFWQADEEFFAASGMLDVLGMRDSFFGIGPKSISSWSTASSLNRDNTLWGAMERSGLPGSDVLGRLLLGHLDWRGAGVASFAGTASSPTPLSFSDDAAARRRARESYGLEDLVVGNAIWESLASQSTQGQGPWSSADYRNGLDIESDNAAARGSYTGGRDFAADVQRRRELIAMGLDPDEVGDVADGAARMSQRTIDPRRALALVEGRLSTRMATDTPAGVRSTLEDAMRDLADPRFADALRGRYVLTSEQAASVGAVQQQYGAVRWGNDTYRRDLSAFSRGLSGLDDDAVRLHALTDIAQSLNPGYRIEGDVTISRMPVVLARDTSVLGLPSRMLGGIEAFFNGPAGYGDDGNPLFLNPRTHSYQGQEEIAFEVAAMGMTPTPGPRGVSVARSGLAFGVGASERYAATLTAAERSSLGYASNEVITVVSRESGEIVAQQVLEKTGGRPREDLLDAMRGNTVTHNHPSGGPLGYDDMTTAIAYGAREFRAVGPENTRVLDLSQLPADLRRNALTTLGEIRASEQAAFLQAHPNYQSYSAAQRFSLSSQVLENMVQQFATRLPEQVRYYVVPSPK